jgi:hypothetical protein
VRQAHAFIAVTAGAFLVGCSDSTGPGVTPLDCSSGSVHALAVGEHEVIDPSQSGACIRLPAADGAGAKYLYVPLSTAGQETQNGVSSPYLVMGNSGATAAPPAMPSPVLSAFRPRLSPDRFHTMLRQRERELAADPSRALFSENRQPVAAAAVPVIAGEQRTFSVCSADTCKSFSQTTATAKAIGSRVAIFVDDSAPAGGYDATDLDQVKTLFDQYLYQIDTTAFGRESDIDNNGVVIVLLTPKVNALSPDCSTTGRIILGYFFGADLLPKSTQNPGSNEGEVFYGLVPDPTNSACTVPKDEASGRLPATFIHEFQHMISFNQHVLLRGGNAEDTWLNEGLSHFAEELGGRLIPDTECPVFGTCESEFIEDGDIPNAFAYLASVEDFYLVEPGNSTGTLEERGANWLFVRWLADHFATDSILGTSLTRALLATTQVGSTNVTARTGVDFSTLVGEWQLANYLDDLPGFTAASDRLRYKSWNFRSLQNPYPLQPDSTDGTSYQHTGTLRAGSGRHVLVAQAPNAGSVDLKLTSPTGGALPTTVQPRVALVRIR